MQSPNEIVVNPQDLLDTVTGQRDAAMNEIVKMSAIIRALQREVAELKKEPVDVQAS